MPGAISNINRRILASCLGVFLLFILLMLVSLSSEYQMKSPPKIVTHEVRSLVLPPPPPPPPAKRKGGSDSPRPSLTRARVETPVELEVMDLEADIGVGGIRGFGTGSGFGTGEGLGDGAGGWGITGLFELDNIPMVRSAPPFNSYPEEAIARNVPEFIVKVHIIVDEEGKTYPVRILKTPYPSMNKEIMEWVSTVLFTPPTRMGVPVKTEYLWPLLIEKP